MKHKKHQKNLSKKDHIILALQRQLAQQVEQLKEKDNWINTAIQNTPALRGYPSNIPIKFLFLNPNPKYKKSYVVKTIKQEMAHAVKTFIKQHSK